MVPARFRALLDAQDGIEVVDQGLHQFSINRVSEGAWPIGAAAQYCLIAFASLAATVLVYELCVRRTTVTRFLFGLKPIRGPVSATRVPPAPRPGRRAG